MRGCRLAAQHAPQQLERLPIPQVEAANAEVERGNQARQSDFAGAAERLRKQSVGEYEARPRAAPRAGSGLRVAGAGLG